jgi:hypothetical protein
MKYFVAASDARGFFLSIAHNIYAQKEHNSRLTNNEIKLPAEMDEKIPMQEKVINARYSDLNFFMELFSSVC